MDYVVQFMQGLWTVMGNYDFDSDTVREWWAGNYEKLTGFGTDSFAFLPIAIFDTFMPTTTESDTSVPE